ncbi:DUF1249 domain-containing protein [Spongiibacter nanhainus]|uniref:DUF1249 domain-containing protein n=1 Tax=Spongiibacter nanhainus TaxID=2794344 RepID=A0A7T4UQE7_9GAMM|nr:DUF1249 domain-containing protein [Spongiibacter nanhainus]
MTRSVVNSAPYKVDLSAHLADCEMNYLRLQKILPNSLEDGQCLRFQMGTSQLGITVIEQAPYTAMLELRLNRASGASWTRAELQVRMYHDAALAEVVASKGGRPLRPRYHYPNSAMYQRDEKAQRNRFLGEWLSYCLRCGHALDTPITSVDSL